MMQFAFWAGLFFVVGSTVDDRAMYPVLATAVSHGLGLQLYKGHFLLSIFAAAAKVGAKATLMRDAAACITDGTNLAGTLHLPACET